MQEIKAQLEIWIDGDACPRDIKEMVYKSAQRTGVIVHYIANRPHQLPRYAFLRSHTVSRDPDAADEHIVENIHTGDIVMTSDIPLAHAALQKKAAVISPRGENYTLTNIGDRLATRNLMEQLRQTGQVTGGPPEFGAKEKRNFAAVFDRLLTKGIQVFP